MLSLNQLDPQFKSFAIKIHSKYQLILQPFYNNNYVTKSRTLAF